MKRLTKLKIYLYIHICISSLKCVGWNCNLDEFPLLREMIKSLLKYFGYILNRLLGRMPRSFGRGIISRNKVEEQKRPSPKLKPQPQQTNDWFTFW